MNRRNELVLALIILFSGLSCLFADDIKLPKSWILEGELPKVPRRRVNAKYPMSDQANVGKWVRYDFMSDEFEGQRLDAKKWWPRNPSWLGRQPGWFYERNVAVKDGKLELWMKKEQPKGMPKDKGYHSYTSAAVQSKGVVLYGYFEVKCRPMDSAGSSSFWFYKNDKELWTEIDVFEIGGRAKGFEKKYNMNVHVFKTPAEKKHWSRHGVWEAKKPLAGDYHVYGLEWDEEKISWYFDGVLIRWIENTHWHQPLTMNFDSETMGDWFGLPADEDLPSVYRVEYVRAWKKDPFAGDWQGSGVDSLGNEYVFAAKVIAMGDGKYRMLVLDAIDSQNKPMHVMDGVLKDGEFPHTADGGVYVGSGRLDGDVFTGYYKGPVDGSYTMQRLVCE